MVHVSSSKQVEPLIKLIQILHIPVVVLFFQPMSTCKRVVRSPIPRNTTDEEFVGNVPDAIASQQISIRKPGSEPFHTNTVILTFLSTTTPTSISKSDTNISPFLRTFPTLFGATDAKCMDTTRPTVVPLNILETLALNHPTA